jgi:hypothetical protein
MSMKYLNENQFKKMWGYYEEIKSSVDNILKK